MTTNHTPEPWTMNKVDEGQTDNGYKEHINVCQASTNTPLAKVEHSGLDWEEYEANAQRIIECVNACKGIEHPSKDIPQMIEVIEGCIHRLKHLDKQLLESYNQKSVCELGEVIRAKKLLDKINQVLTLNGNCDIH